MSDPEDNMLFSDTVLTVDLDETGRWNKQATRAISQGKLQNAPAKHTSLCLPPSGMTGTKQKVNQSQD